MRGAIRDKWAAMGWESSYLGFPASDDEWIDDGRTGGAFVDFQGDLQLLVAWHVPQPSSEHPQAS